MPPPAACETVRIPVNGHEIATYSIGSGKNVLVLVHGGPGLSCDYLRDSHQHLASGDLRIVAYDQLGCGASDRPVDERLWVLDRYVEELEIVRATLGLGKINLLGQSWGAFLGVEYALKHPDNLRSLILEGGAASMPVLAAEQSRLRAALGSETIMMMQRHEAEGTFDHPEYKGAIDVLNYRHVCRLQSWPDCLIRSISDVHLAAYHAIQGENEFVFTGNLKEWARLDALHRLAMPVLIMAGMHDLVTPLNALMMHQRLPDSRIKIFQNSSHVPFLEEPDVYFQTLTSFLQEI